MLKKEIYLTIKDLENWRTVKDLKEYLAIQDDEVMLYCNNHNLIGFLFVPKDNFVALVFSLFNKGTKTNKEFLEFLEKEKVSDEAMLMGCEYYSANIAPITTFNEKIKGNINLDISKDGGKWTKIRI